MVNKKSTCLFCSLGCGLSFRTAGEQITAVDYDKENPVNHGSLCPRGYYNLELLNHPFRLTDPVIGKRKVQWEEAIVRLEQGLKEFSGDEIGILVSCNSSNEDAFAAARLAKKLGTKYVAAMGDPADLEAYQGYRADVPGANLANLKDIENSEALLIIGDILTRSAVLSRRVNQVKYGKRGNKIIVVDPNPTHTAWFATRHIKPRPGTDATMVAEMVEQGINEFSSAASGTIIFAPDVSRGRNDLIGYFIKLLSTQSPNKKFIIFYSYGNTLGVNMSLDQEIPEHSSYRDVKKKVEDGQIKALLMLGEFQPELAKKVRFAALTDYFAADINDGALVMPLASHLEGEASYTMADGRTEKLLAVASPVGVKSNLDIISALLKEKVLPKNIPGETKYEKVDLKRKLEEAKLIPAREVVPQMEISHFGSNSLAKHFFWYRVNN